MSLYTICFSPTGGAQKVMEILSSAWKEKTTVIDLSEYGRDFSKTAFAADDVCLIGVPSFGGRVPEAAFARLFAMKGNGARAVLTVVYGNRAYDDTLLELQDIALACGFRVSAAVTAVAEHSIMRQFGAGRPDGTDESELLEFAAQIQQALAAGREDAPLSLPGNRPFREYSGVPFKPKAGRGCTGCGVCVKRCPVGAIPADNPKATSADRCISCMRCIAVCPAKARSLNKAVLFAAGKKMKKALEGRKPNELFLPARK